MILRIVFPNRSILGAAVTGTPDATYPPAWLTDGRPDHPVKFTGDLSLTIAPAATDIDMLAVTHQAIRQAATITIGGDISTTIPTAAPMADGIPRGWFRRLTSPVAAVDSLTLAVTGNTDPIYIGNFYAGLSWTPEAGVKHGRQLDPGQQFPWEGEYGLMAPRWAGVRKARRYRCELLLTDAEVAEVQNGELAQLSGERPCLVTLDDTKNDAMLAVFNLTETTDGGNHFYAIEIVEIPAIRWPA